MDEREARRFDTIARTVFAPIYPIIARQIIQRTGIREGTCVDLGCGPCHLSIALARVSQLKILSLDNAAHMIAVARENIRQEALCGRIRPVVGDVSALPLKPESVRLVISRGSLPFWPNRPAVYHEVHLILAPGGRTYMGGGFGNGKLKKKIFQKMRERFDDWDANVRNRKKNLSADLMVLELEATGIGQYAIVDDESGLWINIKKG